MAFSRRDFLEGIGLGAAAILIPACFRNAKVRTSKDPCTNAGPKTYVRQIRGMRDKKHNYVLPDESVLEKNIIHALLDIECEYAKNHAPQQVHDIVRAMKDKFDYTSGEFGKLAGINNIEALMTSGEMLKSRKPSKEELNTYEVAVVQLMREMYGAIIVVCGFDVKAPEHQYISSAFLTGKITPNTLHTLMLGVSEQYRLPLVGVSMPSYVFSRWKGPARNINFDSGLFLQDENYFDNAYNPNAMQLPPESIKSGAYFREMTKKEIIGVNLSMIAQELYSKEEFMAALDTAALAVKWAPRQPEAHIIYGQKLLALEYNETAYREYEIARQLNPLYEIPEAVLKMRVLVRENGIEECF
jgi:hypothetical protein